jgi:hypothetical protein
MVMGDFQLFAKAEASSLVVEKTGVVIKCFWTSEFLRIYYALERENL